MRIFLALKTRICLFRLLFNDNPGVKTAQSLLRHLYALMCMCDVCVFYEYASTNPRIDSGLFAGNKKYKAETY